MFENLTGRLETTLKRLRGEARLTEVNISDTLREVRMALLEADVALPVVKAFIDDVRTKAVGQEVLTSLTPGQAVIKVVYDALIALMGEKNERLNLAVRPPAVVLMAGLQGSGKTTSAAKLARLLREREKKSVLLVSVDVYRPAAIDQLQKLAVQVGANFFPSRPDQKPEDIAHAALEQARVSSADVLVVDTAGRLHVDAAMMDEIRGLHAVLNPVETLFVVDSMTGQDAVKTAKAFGEALPLSGVILTKTDGDARGGAALSVRFITGKPIKFLGVGEKTDALEPFHPDRLASRILGMGDVLSLVEQAQRGVDPKSTIRVHQGANVKLEALFEHQRQVSAMKNPLCKYLPLVQIHSAPADLAPVDRQLLRVAIIYVDFLFQFLVIANTDIRRGRTHQHNRVRRIWLERVGDRMVDRLRANRRHETHVEHANLFHWSSSSPS